MDVKPRALIIGSGECAREVAGLLDAEGVGAILTAPAGAAAPTASAPAQTDANGIEIFDGRLVACHGQAGAFQVVFDRDGTRCIHRVAGIVVAEDALRTPNFPIYGLQPSRRVISLSEMEARLAADPSAAPADPGARIAFLNAWQPDSHPVTAARMLRLCRRIQDSAPGRTVFLTGNLKVSVDGMEACCQEAKAAGTLFLKFSERLPRIEPLDDGRVRFDYWDETTRRPFRMTADVVIVDETIQPHPSLLHLSDVLRLERDAAGYLQSDNVRRLSNSTNRRGIFVAGGSRAFPDGDRQRAEAARVVLKFREFLSASDVDPHPEVEIDQGRCARCLTCYRLCPYAAIEMSPRMTIVAQACQSCGVCAAGCPNQAIRVADADLEAALQSLHQRDAMATGSGAGPQIAVFGCRRSAVEARESAIRMGHLLPPGLNFVEGLCGGTFSVNHLLSAFDAGMDGVMVLTCHAGNCHSEDGTGHARKRVAEASRALGTAGVAAERIAYNTLSANMGSEFVRLVDDFARRIAAMGNS